MKDQYFGDFGDYQKFSLLKTLRDIGKFKVTVHWVKTKDDGGNDGGRISYLENPVRWRFYDEEIFDFLKECVERGERKLSLFGKSVPASDMQFVSGILEVGGERLWLLEKMQKDKFSDLIFFDPDNGIEVQATNRRNRHKYVLWDEIDCAYGLGKSVLVYQHFPMMKNRDMFIREKLGDLKKRFSCTIFAIKVTHSVYFLIAKKKHATNIHKALTSYSDTWKGLVSVKKSPTHEPKFRFEKAS